MKRKRVILISVAVVIAAALLAVYYFYLGSTVPNAAAAGPAEQFQYRIAEECMRVRDLLSKKIEELDARMDSIKKFRRVLARHLNECERELSERGQNACCPVVAIGKTRSPLKRDGKKNADGSRKS